MTPLSERFAARLARDPDLIPAGCTVLAALSGGSDSLALLALLVDVAEDLRLTVHAAHFDHGARPGSADEARSARVAADRLGVTCTIGRADAPLSGQTAYRDARFAFLDRVAADVGADRIALAHQLDDHVETVLLRLLRGTGLRGLAGIRERRGLYVRPLLGFTRDELKADLEDRGIRWASDPSNRDPRYARARVRHRLLPALRAVSPEGEPERTVATMAARAAHADRGLDTRTAREASPFVQLVRPATAGPAESAQIARFPLQDYDPAVLGRLIRLLARACGSRLRTGGTRLAVQFMRRGLSGHSVDPGGGLRLSREYDRLLLSRPNGAVAPDGEVAIPAAEPGEGAAMLGGRTYRVRWGSTIGPSTWSLALEPDRVRFPLRLRAPRPGDRIRTGVGTRKLKKVLNEGRVPRSRRPQVPVLEDADGDIVWIVGRAIADRPGGGGRATFTIGVDGVRDVGN